MFGLFKKKKSQLEVGQIWKYENRIGEDDSTVIILKIEERNGQEIVHIAVGGVRIKNKDIEGGISKEIDHLPFDKTSITESLRTLVSSNNPLPDFEEGYNHWNQAFENNQAGIFTISIKDAVKFVEETLNPKNKGFKNQ